MWRLLLLATIALAVGGCGGSAGESGSAEAGAADAAAGALATGTSGPAPAPAAEPASRTDEAPRPAPRAAEAPPPAATSPEAPAEAGVTVWVTRDAGAELLREGQVKSGLTAIQALDVVAELETNYGGRYVSSIDGLSSDFDGQSDWFFLVNGIEPDVGGAELKVVDGDLVWWDYRNWIDSAAHPAAAVGAFPKPFHRGWKSAVRPVEVVAPEPLGDLAQELDLFLGANEPDDPEAEPHRFVLELRPEAGGAELTATMGSKNSSPVTFVLAGSEVAVRAAAAALLANPDLVARRYAANFDAHGQVIGP